MAVVDVTSCGAVGDGAADCTQAFHEAVGRLPRSGGVLYVPPGKFVLQEAVHVADQPIAIRGEGIGISVLIWAEDAGSTGLLITQGIRQGTQTDFTRVEHLSLYTFKRNEGTALTVDVEGQQAPEADGIIANRTAPRLYVNNLEVRGQDDSCHGWGECIKMRCVLHCVLTNIHMTGCSNGLSPCGMVFEGGRGHVEVQITACWGFYLDHAILIRNAIEGVKVMQCDFVAGERPELCSCPIDETDSHVTAVNNGITCQESCLQLSLVNNHLNCRVANVNCRNINQSSIMGNLLYKEIGSQCNSVGIQMRGSSAWNVIANNVFISTCQNPGCLFHCIVFQDGACQNLVQGNNFGICTDGVICQGGATANTICGNNYDTCRNPCQDQDGRNKYFPM